MIHADSRRMVWLVKANRAAARQAESGKHPPGRFLNCGAGNMLRFQRLYLLLHVIAHEIEDCPEQIVLSLAQHEITFRRMNASSAGGNAKISQPCPAPTELNPNTSRKNAL